jgi:GAF domain-containing protein
VDVHVHDLFRLSTTRWLSIGVHSRRWVSWVSDPTDGPWEPATEHDDKVLGDDPPTMPATLAEAVRARASRPHMPSRPPVATRPHTTSSAPQTASTPHASSSSSTQTPSSTQTSSSPQTSSSAQTPTPTPDAQGRPGTLVVVATGADAERVRGLCHDAALDVTIVPSLASLHDTAPVVVIGEPSPPAPSRVVHVARPTLSDDMLLALLRAFVTSKVVADPPPRPSAPDARMRELADRLAAETDAVAIERLGAEAILALADADRAQLLFHDPASGALWSESNQRTTGDDRRAVAGIVGWCAQTGHAVMASPSGDDPRYLLDLDDPDGKPQARVLVQPVIGGDRRVHALLVAARRWRRTDFTDGERASLRDFAALIAATIDALTLVAPRRAARSTLPGVATAHAAAAYADNAKIASSSTRPATPMTDLRPPSTRASTEPGHLSPPNATQTPPNSDLRSLAASPSVTSPASATSPSPTGPVQTSPTMRSLPPMPAKPPATEPVRAKRASGDDARAKRPSLGEPRARRPSAEESKRSSRDGIEPRDVAVVTTDAAENARVGKLARKARLEVSVLSSPEEVPPYYRIVTLGEAWTPDSDSRVAYAARSEITDDQLIELLAGIASERAPAPLVAVKPQTVAEARRLQPAFASLRTIAGEADLAAAETTLVAALKRIIDADRAYCLYFDADDGSLWSETRRRKTNDDRLAIAGVVGWCARTGRTANVERASADPRWLGPLDDPEGDPNSQLLVQPVITADRRVIGVLAVVRRPKRPGFTDADVALLVQLAALASPMLEQLVLADDVQLLLRDSSGHVAQSPVQRLVAGVGALPRWSYALAGAAVTAAIMAAAGC